MQSRKEVAQVREHELSMRRLHQHDTQRRETQFLGLQQQQQQDRAENEKFQIEIARLASKCASHEKETKKLKFYISTLPLPEAKKMVRVHVRVRVGVCVCVVVICRSLMYMQAGHRLVLKFVYTIYINICICR